ncbi:IclR family transcriptional regulator [Pseudonocardia ailaonensis]|uniref:IclR family transcriptional regulator n=1 Tax=Pseudonocardia ailaonensis TaxID=367279 RepID=A0ABN2N0N2_9PSEU
MTDLTSALRPVAILEYLAAHPDGAALRDIRDELDLPRSSVWLLVRQLVEGGYVHRVDDTRFTVGSRLLRMGLNVYQIASMGGDGRMYLQSLSSETGLDVYLAIRTGDNVVYADRVFGANSVQIRHRLGEPRSLHASAAGKLFLAFDEDGLWERRIDGRTLESFTPHTLVDHDALRAQLAEARLRGYVDVRDEVLTSICSIGAMSFDPDGSPWGAVVVSAHESDLGDRHDEVLATLLETVRQLTAARSAIGAGAR